MVVPPSKWPFHGLYMGVTNYLLSGEIADQQLEAPWWVKHVDAHPQALTQQSSWESTGTVPPQSYVYPPKKIAGLIKGLWKPIGFP